MAYRNKNKQAYEKQSNEGAPPVDEHLLYSNQNIELVKSSAGTKNSVPREPLRQQSRRIKKFDSSQGSNWIGSSNSNIDIKSQQQNSKKRERADDKKGNGTKYDHKMVIKQKNKPSSENSQSEESASGSEVKYNNKKRDPKRWDQRNYSIRNFGNPELDELVKNTMKFKKQATQHHQAKKKVMPKSKKFSNDIDNDSDEDLSIDQLTSQNSQSNRYIKHNSNQDSKQKTSSHRKQSSDNQQRGQKRKPSMKKEINHIGNIGEGLERSNSKKLKQESGRQQKVSSGSNKQEIENAYQIVEQEQEDPESVQSDEQEVMSHDSENSIEPPEYDVVGQGILTEVYQMRGDEDSRRYRVFQHYLRTNVAAKKYTQTKQQKSEGDPNSFYQWSSSSSHDEDDEGSISVSTKLSQRSKIQSLMQSFNVFNSKASPSKKITKQVTKEKKEQLTKRINLRKNITDQKINLRSFRSKQKSDNLDDKRACEISLKKMLSLNSHFSVIEKSEHYDGKMNQDKKLGKKRKKTSKNVQLPPLMILGSDEDQYYDQTIQLLSQDQDNQKDLFLFDPDSTGKAAWEVMGLFFIIYQSIIIPYRLCLEVPAENGWFYIEYAIDMSFIADIFVQFNTGFYSKGNLVMQRGKIVKNYLGNWFFIDVVASFPYSWLTPPVSEDDQMLMESEKEGRSALSKTPQLLKMFKLARFLRFLRLLRVFKLKQILYRIEELIMNDAIVAFLNLLKVFFVVLFIGHWIACVFYSIGASELASVYDCWLTNAGLQDEAKEVQYIASLYWAFATMTTVGYGDLYPITIPEKLFAMLSMLVACAVFAYVVGSIETIVRRSNTIENLFKEKILHVNQYLTHQRIPRSLRLQVRRYLEQMQEHKKREKLSQNEVLKMLNVNLRDEVLIHIVGKMIRQNRIFVRLFDDRLQSELIFLLQQKMFLMDDHIFEEGDKHDKIVETIVFEEPDQNKELIQVKNEQKQKPKDREADGYKDQGLGLFFIIQGQIILLERKSKTYITDLGVEAIFGEISFFSGKPRTLTAKSRGFSELMYLNQAKFLSQIHMKHPHAVQRYEDIRQRLAEKPDDYGPLFIRCFRCHEKGHIAINCPLFSDWKGNLVKNKQNQKETDDLLNKDIRENQRLKDLYQKLQNPNGHSSSLKDLEDDSDGSNNSIRTNTEIKSSDYEDPHGKGGKDGSQLNYNDNSTRSKYSRSNATKQKHSRSDEKDSSWHGSTKNKSDINNRSLRGGTNYQKAYKVDGTPTGNSVNLNNPTDPQRQSKQSRKTQNLEKVKEYDIEFERDSNENEVHVSTGNQKNRQSNLLGPSVQFQTASYGSKNSCKDSTPPPDLNKHKSELNFTNAFNAHKTQQYNHIAQSQQRLPTNNHFAKLDGDYDLNEKGSKPTLARFQSDKLKKPESGDGKVQMQSEDYQQAQAHIPLRNIQKSDALFNSSSGQSKQLPRQTSDKLANPVNPLEHPPGKLIKIKQNTLQIPEHQQANKKRLLQKASESSKSRERHNQGQVDFQHLKEQRRISVGVQQVEHEDDSLKKDIGEAKEASKPSIRRTSEANMYVNKRPPSGKRSGQRQKEQSNTRLQEKSNSRNQELQN